jgi:amino acid transporter
MAPGPRHALIALGPTSDTGPTIKVIGSRRLGDMVSQSGDRLKSGQLGTADVTASTVANIGPGIDFYFGFGVIAVTAGVAAPLTILAATVAVGLLAFTVAEFTRAEPSAGSFITYVDTALGPEPVPQRPCWSRWGTPSLSRQCSPCRVGWWR